MREVSQPDSHFSSRRLCSSAPDARAHASPKPDDIGRSRRAWETQKQARTYILSIPAPRGQITDRNGSPLAQTRVSYNLAINFPTPLKFTDREALDISRIEQIRHRPHGASHCNRVRSRTSPTTFAS